MPAIHLIQLRQHSAQLADLFDQPANFVRKLHSVLGEYSNRTHRPGQTGEPAPLLDSYNVPKPVIRQILIDIRPMVIEDPQSALRLCDELWKESYLEMRFLAASMLGQVTPDPSEPVLVRIKEWSEQISSAQLIEVLFDKGLDRIRIEKPDYLIEQIERWLNNPNVMVNKLGLQALIPLIRSASYENIPIFFRQISPVIREMHTMLQVDMRNVVTELAKRSPVETAYYLRQLITMSNSTSAAWLTRQNLRYFPSDIQNSLRELLRTPQPER